MMGVVGTSETSDSFLETTLRKIPEHSHVHTVKLGPHAGADLFVSVLVRVLFGSYICDHMQNMLLSTKIFL
jgi:hypothetical protein